MLSCESSELVSTLFAEQQHLNVSPLCLSSTILTLSVQQTATLQQLIGDIPAHEHADLTGNLEEGSACLDSMLAASCSRN